MPKPYKDTSKATNALQTPKKGQNERKTQVTLADVINSILTFVLLAGALFIFVLFLPQKAHSYASLTNYPAKQVKNNLPLGAGIGQNKDLSKNNSGQASRYPLAFFVPDNRLTSQVSNYESTTHLTQITGLNRHIYAHSVTNYGEVTSQNKIAFTVNMRGGFFRAKSEPCLPPFWDWQSLLTQQSKGVANHG